MIEEKLSFHHNMISENVTEMKHEHKLNVSQDRHYSCSCGWRCYPEQLWLEHVQQAVYEEESH